MQTPSSDNESPQLKLAVFTLLSFTSGLFFFGCFKLMNFHWISMSVLLSLLLIGMPIGGLLVVRYLRADLASLSLGLRLQVGVMLLALVLYPLFLDPASRLDSLLTGTLRVSGLTFLMFKFLQLGLVFVPYYIVFGMNEFLGYRIALGVLGQRTELAYAIFLGGTSLAYACIEFGSPYTGVVPLMVAGAGTIGMVGAQLHRRFRGGGIGFAAFSTLLIALALTPGLEDRYISQLELDGVMQLRTMRKKANTEILHREWGRYLHFSVIADSPTRIAGFYNGGLHWYHQTGRTLEDLKEHTMETIPFSALPENPSILIIGAGGGQQVATALLHDPKRVVAVEIIPEVIELLSGKLDDRLDGAYNDPRVETVKMDGRQYLAQTDERFDLIFLPVVDTSITMLRSLFNSAETLYTVEAFEAMRDHLSDRGTLVIQRPANFDVFGVLLRQYFRALQDVGLSPFVWLDNPKALQGLTGPGIAGLEFGTDPIYFLFGRRTPQGGNLSAEAVAHLKENNFARVDDFGDFEYSPKTDNFRLRSDQLFNIFGSSPLNWNMAVLLAVIATVVTVILVVLHRQFRTEAAPIPFAPLVGLAILIGLNFLLLQQFLIFSLYRVLEIPMDAVFLGSVGYMMLAGLAGVALTAHESRFTLALAVSILAALLLGAAVIVPETMLGVLVALPLVAMTGGLFPSVFRGGEKMLLVVFGGDAVGALIGGVVAFLWPIALGFRSYGVLTLCVFVVTALSVWWARRRYDLVNQQAG